MGSSSIKTVVIENCLERLLEVFNDCLDEKITTSDAHIIIKYNIDLTKQIMMKEDVHGY